VKKTTLINQDISCVIAGMGHLDMLVVADAGLPIPDQVRRIDLALIKGIPTFEDTVKAISSELSVQTIIIADETCSQSPHILSFLKKQFQGIEVQCISHAEFKEKISTAKAVIRTGEFTPYANVILVSGVSF